MKGCRHPHTFTPSPPSAGHYCEFHTQIFAFVGKFASSNMQMYHLTSSDKYVHLWGTKHYLLHLLSAIKAPTNIFPAHPHPHSCGGNHGSDFSFSTMDSFFFIELGFTYLGLQAHGNHNHVSCVECVSEAYPCYRSQLSFYWICQNFIHAL